MKRLVIVLTGVVVLLAGCGFNPADLPIPGTYVSGDKYSIKIELSSALNLPDKAKVIAEGVDVGVMDHVDLVGNRAVATVDVKSDVQLPVSTRAELRQSTILGEIYISLLPPKDTGGPYLADGGVIPIAQTAPADNVEDLLRGMSSLITGGRVTELQDMVTQFNAAFPSSGDDFNRIYAAGRDALHDLSANTDDLDRILNSAASITTTMEANRAGVDVALTAGPGRAAGLSTILFGVVDLIFKLGYLTPHISDLLVPIAGDIHDVIKIISPALLTIASADSTVPMNIDRVNKLLRDKLIPFFSAPPNIRVQKVGNGAADASAQADQMILVLRSIGMVR